VRRLPRTLLHVLTVLSAVLFVATVALWVRSYVATEWFVYQRTDSVNRRWWHFTFVSNSGLIYISRPSHDFNAIGLAERHRKDRGDPDGFWYLRQPPESHWGRTRFGFKFVLSDVSYDSSGRSNFPRAYIPYWFVALMTAVLPCAWWGRRRQRRKRRREHRCLCCGYDLRATPERCPECGAIANEKVAGRNDPAAASR
jgi:hypothetical protein